MTKYPRHLRSVVENVFHISNGTDSGTAFRLELDGTCYLVTAGHFTPQLGRELYISFQMDKAISSSYAKVWHHQLVDVRRLAAWTNDDSNGPDVAFIELCEEYVDVPPLKFSRTETFVGQEVLLFGFPHNTMLPEGGIRYPLPLLRRQVISGSHGERIFLDGFNVPGESGGPIVALGENKQEAQIIGVIGGCLTHDLASIGAARCSDQFFDGLQKSNLGIGWATELGWAVDALQQQNEPGRWQSFDCS